MDDSRSALVLFSGGQDSTTCLAWALNRFQRVETVAFDYRQRHRVELDQRLVVLDRIRAGFPQWADRLGEDHFVDMAVLGQISETSLTRDVAFAMQQDGLPNTFVPGRNLLFFTFAAAIAWRRNIRHLIGGMCETDYSGYPDCRDNTIKALQVALNLGMDRNFALHTPLMWRDKAETWALAQELGGEALIEIIREHTHTCYRSERDQRHDWGYGCGECPACVLRKHGYESWNARAA
ncbi:preQ(0) biosynthesis protein QueC [Enhydrobacter aerosaccus]|uniref:7-cyano-7-deazaguanine synthase n=1 Tax=Enhydrobacter aerosaccus TaxID=225324 RepID=A0A1T4RAX8_9HYPH|nr:7-cyano-7-deazaguanine synthase QueC [Enhydrobacter aerosaccus]SKA13069.1 preQ(0) biosynthesis protein QueC [Enhydrobacter aerosaccus]